MLGINVTTYNSKEKLIDSCDMFFLDAVREIPIEIARELLQRKRISYVKVDANNYRTVYTRTIL